jgi:rSAM/selenodomain-associated transferase 2
LKVSVIIPVYKEEKIINGLAGHIQKRSAGKSPEIIVVDGDPEGSTVNAIKDRNVIKLKGDKGRASQMNYGAKYATHSILFFLHADSYLPAGCFSAITEIMEKTDIAAGAFNLGIDSDSLWLKAIAKGATIRSRLTGIPYGDQGFFIKKEIFNKINGFSDLPLMEDIDIMQKLKKQNYKMKLINQKLITSPRRWEKQGIVYCSLRNVVLSGLFYLGVPAATLKKYY